MDPNAGEPHRDDPENSDTIAQQKKRARRVSFAENTSVHFFNRDDEYDETPPLSETPKAAEESAVESGTERAQKEFDDGGDVDDVVEIRSSFLRPIGSPSSGGSTIGSASSIDEDDFFGPVSANFIRPGRLSDSAVSDDMHDVTMDSTAFSMHFHSLAASDSGMDLKTPADRLLCSEQKTPTNADAGHAMSLTMRKKPVLFSSVAVMEASGTDSRNDMSIIGESNDKYDYGKLSPGLDALLAESRKDPISFGSTSNIVDSKLPMTKDSDILKNSTDRRESPLSLRNHVRSQGGEINFHEMESNGYGVSVATDPIKTLPLGHSPESSPMHEAIPITASPSRHLGVTTPLPEKQGSFLAIEFAENHESQTSIQKSISKLESLEKYAFSSTFSSKVDRSSVKLLDFGKSPSFGALSEKHRITMNSFEDSITKEKLGSNHRNKEKGHAVIAAHTEIGTSFLGSHPKASLGHNIEKPPVDSSLTNTFGDCGNHGGIRSSPSKNTQPGDNLNNFMESDKYAKDVVMHETDSLLAEITSGGGLRETKFIHSEFASPPSRIVEKILSPSPRRRSSRPRNVQSPSQFKRSVGVNKEQDLTLTKNLRISDGNADMNAKSLGIQGELCLNADGVDRLRNLIEVKATSIQNDGMNSPSDVLTPALKTSFVQRKTLDEVNLVATDMPEDAIQRKENDVHHVPSPKSAEQSGVPTKNSTPYKRNLELLQGHTHSSPKMTTMQQIRRGQIGGDCSPDTPFYPAEVNVTVTDNGVTKLADMHLKFSEDIKVLISELAMKLNSKTVEDLEDILFHWQRSKMYDLIHCNIVPKKTAAFDYLRLEKADEIKSLLQRIIFDKSRLQLKLARTGKLSRRLQDIRSRIQEAQKLRADIMCQTLKAPVTNILAERRGKQSSVISEEQEDCNENLTSMKQTCNTLERKILTIKRSLCTSFKMKAGLSSAEMISLLNEHLKKRALFRSISQEMQVWVIDKVGRVENQQNIVLNYLDIIMQSIKLTPSPTSTVTSSVILNEANIMKNFPSMDAFTAFSVVFNTETTCKYIRSKTFPCVTQVTRSLLGTLLDVIEEVQSAQLDFPNLGQLSFSSPSYCGT